MKKIVFIVVTLLAMPCLKLHADSVANEAMALKLVEERLATIKAAKADNKVRSAREYYQLNGESTTDLEQAAYKLKYDIMQGVGEPDYVQFVVEWWPVPGKTFTQRLRLKRPLP